MVLDKCIDKNIGVLTFHGAHNYGSVLQAYALQNIITYYLKDNKDNIKYKYNIINLRTKEQKNLYKIIKKNNSIGNIVGNVFNMLHYFDLKKKYDKFEKFINNKLSITDKEYSTLKEVEDDIDKYDYLLCGSDQIWNTRAFDFNWGYYFPFNTNAKKISYAASFGSSVDIKDEYIKKQINKNLQEFDCISVRESNSSKIVSEMIDRTPEILIDPTLMIGENEWNKLLINSDEINELGDYIFFYSLGPSKEDIEIVNFISKKTGLPIVISNTATRNDKTMKAKRILSAGPQEFLTLIKNAKFLCTTSFHGTVFSIIFETPFFCINVDDDDRISSLLNKVKLTSRLINNNNYMEKYKEINNISFNNAKEEISKEQEKSKKYILDAFDIGGEK